MRRIVPLLLVCALVLVACAGERGPEGPMGPQGDPRSASQSDVAAQVFIERSRSDLALLEDDGTYTIIDERITPESYRGLYVKGSSSGSPIIVPLMDMLLGTELA